MGRKKTSATKLKEMNELLGMGGTTQQKKEHKKRRGGGGNGGGGNSCELKFKRGRSKGKSGDKVE